VGRGELKRRSARRNLTETRFLAGHPGTERMMKPVSDKAEVALEYPEKFYSGTFARSSRFEAGFDSAGVSLVLERSGSSDEKKSVHIHLHYGLFADVLEQLAESVVNIPDDDPNLEHLFRSVARLSHAFEARPAQKK
jgi:hypothetical protein